jgi:hypothetical protein
MKRVLFAVFVCISLLIFYYETGADTFTCLTCHGAMKGKIKTEKGVLIDVNVDGERYAQSVHGGFNCITCHKQFGSNPHESKKSGNVSHDVATLASKLSHKAKVDAVALASCSECHGDAYKS